LELATAPTTQVKVTRRHHPLAGQVLEVVRGGRTQIVLRLSDGTGVFAAELLGGLRKVARAGEVVPLKGALAAAVVLGPEQEILLRRRVTKLR
jgi:hypothetical protein